MLCNACGSRWRTKGTLANYTPLHARAEPDDFEDHRVSKVKSISLNKNKEVKLLKRKHNYDSIMVGGVATDYNQGFRKIMDEEASNRSSSGSAISNSESCVQFGSGDASDLTGWIFAKIETRLDKQKFFYAFFIDKSVELSIVFQFNGGAAKFLPNFL